MEVLSGNILMSHHPNTSSSISPVMSSFNSNRLSTTKGYDIRDNLTPRSHTYISSTYKEREESLQRTAQQEEKHKHKQNYQQPQHQHQKQQQLDDENDEKIDNDDQQQKKGIRKTSSFSNSVEIYQNKLNTKNSKSDSALNESLYRTLENSKPATSTNPRVIVLKKEIVRLREEMLLKVNALENEMSAGQIDVQLKAINKSTQTDQVPIFPKQQLKAATNSIHEENEEECQVTKKDFSLFLNDVMCQMDAKLENIKKEIFQKIDQNIKFCKALKRYDGEMLSSSIQNNNKPRYVTSSSILTQDSESINIPELQDMNNGNLQRDHDRRIDTNLDHVSNNYTRNSNNDIHSTSSSSSSLAVEYRNYQPEYTTVSRTNPPEINQMFAPYKTKSPMLYPYPSSRSHNNNNHSNHIMASTESALHESTNSSCINFNQYSQSAREELARHLVDQLFLYDDLADANVRGVKGKRLLDPIKIQQIRESVFRTYPVRNNENEDYLWKFICDKINAKCRGVTRTLKRKTNEYSYRHNEYPLTHSSMSIPDYHHRYHEDNYEYERCSFVTTDSSAIPTRRRSSSESESSSVELIENNRASAGDRRYSNNLDNSRTEDITRASPLPPFSATVSLSNNNYSDNPDLMLKRKEDTEINVTDDDEDILSDDGGSLGPARDFENEREKDIAAVPPNEIEASLDICDKLAEKYTDHYPNIQGQDSVTDRKRIQGNREEFTRTLIEAMFTRSTLAHSNVTGARGKFMLDPIKIAIVRKTIFKKFPAENEDEAEVLWKILTTKINTKCRGVKRLMKRKGIPAESISKRYHTTIDDGSKLHKVVVVKNESTPYPAIYDEEIHPELTRYPKNNMNC